MHMAIGGGRQRALGPGRQARRASRCGSCCRTMSPEELVDARRLPLPDRRAHARRGARDPARAPSRAAPRASSSCSATGYPAYTTSPGWLGYADDKLRAPVPGGASPTASPRSSSRSAPTSPTTCGGCGIAREAVGDGHPRSRSTPTSAGTSAEAIAWMRALAPFDPWWIEEPTSPDDVLGHAAIRRGGRADPASRPASTSQNRVVFKQLLQAERDRRRADRRLPRRRRQREHRDPAARREVRRARLPARRRRRAVRVRAAPVDVRLRRRVRLPARTASSSSSTTCTSTSSTPSWSSAGALPSRPQAPGFSAAMTPEALAASPVPRRIGVVGDARTRRDARMIGSPLGVRRRRRSATSTAPVSDDERQARARRGLGRAACATSTPRRTTGSGCPSGASAAGLHGRPRDEFVVSTKVGPAARAAAGLGATDDEGFAVPATHVRVRDYSRDGVLRSLESSLERLGLDRVDIAVRARPRRARPRGARRRLPGAGGAALHEGVITSIRRGHEPVRDAAREFVRETDLDVVMLAGRYTLLEQGALDDLLPECERRGVSVIAAGVFNSGLLARDRPREDATYDYEPAPPELVARVAPHRRRPASATARACRSPRAQFALAHPAVATVLPRRALRRTGRAQRRAVRRAGPGRGLGRARRRGAAASGRPATRGRDAYE